ncbi:sensor histidine kinase [Cellulomonas cellasea]|uniref:histidine kinase n=1 Tax=Cellulomonas cellasea TaxID=43670 RepID=A0A7W4UEK2_9CELL|nr:histidine kinase [Cellulomonas cellasea]MBB2922143.1 signal transduction histidine kinase [Cellulomonas cellasea]
MAPSRDRTLDTVLVVGSLLLTAMAARGGWSAVPAGVVAAAGALGSAVLVVRRARPVTVTTVGAAAYALSGNPLPLVVGLWSGGAHAPRRALALVAVAGWSGLAGWWWLDEGRLDAQDAVWAALVTATLVGAGVQAATRRELRAAREAESRQAEVERGLREEQARAAERARIAREMHDVLAHKVTLVALHAGALEVGPGAGDARVRDAAALIRGTAREALQELRDVLGVLRAPDESPAGPGGGADLAGLVADAERAGERVELDVDTGDLPARTAAVVHRVVQEALTNARRHAPGAPVAVRVRRSPGEVTVTVTNPAGVPADLDLPGSGSGLVGLAERVRLAGGAFDAGRAPDGGWRVHAVVPCGDEPFGDGR